MANLTDSTNLTATITLSKATGTKVTLDTDSKYLTKDIELTINAPTTSATTSGTTVSYGEGWISAGSTTISDDNLIAANIKNGVSIFGVTGSYTGSSDGIVLVSESQDEHGGVIYSISTTTDPIYLDTLNVTSNGSYTPTSGHYYNAVNVNVSGSSGSISLQAKTNIDPTESSQTIYPDTGYGGLSSVQINGISSSYVGSGIALRTSSDITNSVLTITVPAGYYSSSATTTLSDANLIAGNIKSGVTVFGITGSYEGSSGGITQDENGYIVLSSAGSSGSSSPSATQHTIHFNFTDSTSTDISVYYNDSIIGTLLTSTIPSSYGQKTISSAALDNVTWYDTTTIPLNTELIDFTKVTNDYIIDYTTGEAVAEQWYSVSDYTPINSEMTFSYTGCRWQYLGFYDSSKAFISSIYMYNDTTESQNNSNIGNGTLSGNEIPSNAAYIRITSVYMSSADDSALSLIRTA